MVYASRTSSKHEKSYGITDLEALGVVWPLRYFRVYLLGHACVFIIDHAPLRALLKAKHKSGKLAKFIQTTAKSSIWKLISIVQVGTIAMRMPFPEPIWSL